MNESFYDTPDDGGPFTQHFRLITAASGIEEASQSFSGKAKKLLQKIRKYFSK